MKAAVRDTYGGPDIVRIEEVDKRAANDGEVLVRVEAASVNRADLDALKPRPGFARTFIGIRAPRNRRLGVDAAGVVEAVGGGTTRFRPGDRVFTDLFTFGIRAKEGAFSEYVCGPEAAFQPIPAGMSFEDAATLPHSAILAIQGLRLRDGRTPKPGDKVLIDGASGNVGPFAVQVAKSLGAEVTGVSRGEKLDFVRSLGADHVIDYTTTDYTKTGQRYDWIVDTDSHHSLLAVRRALRPHGVYVTLGGTSWPILAGVLVAPFISRAVGKRMGLMLWWKPFHAPDLAKLEELIATGKVKPVIDRRYPLDQIVEALHWVDDGHARGKVVISMADEHGPG
jgi:NADPH:quinone reductase-like Zn-dependent oxidoreductase